jgi:Zn-dependent metalloprotease
LAHAQREPKSQRSDNFAMRHLTSKIDKDGWLFFKKQSRVRPEALFTTHFEAMGLKSGDEMRVFRTKESPSGEITYKHKQYYKGIPVLGASYTVHTKNNNVTKSHGKIVEDININTQNIISKQEALAAALGHIRATRYAWQDTLWENSLKRGLENANATYFPTGNLVITPLSGQGNDGKAHKLCFEFDITSTLPKHKREIIYIDAKNRRVVGVQDPSSHCHVEIEKCPLDEKNPRVVGAQNLSNHNDGVIEKYSLDGALSCRPRTGTFNSLFNGTQTFTTQNRWLYGDYVLEDCTRGDLLQTKVRKFFGATSFFFADQVTDGNNSWDTDDQDATTGHWALQKSYDYFMEKFGRNGTDGGGHRKTFLFVRSLDNSSEFGKHEILTSSDLTINGCDLIETGIINGIGVVTLDNIGHEFTHGVFIAEMGENSYPINTGGTERAALNESFAYIFGEMIERYVDGSTDLLSVGQMTTTMARDLNGPLVPFNPSAGANNNSITQNKWFVLLALGGTLGTATVQGIGYDKAAAITYKNMVDYITVSSSFQGSRIGSIQAAIDLFGECSNEVLQVKNAWHAVGIGPAGDECPPPVPTLTMDIENSALGYQVCTTSSELGYGLPMTLTAITNQPNATISWVVPSDLTYSLSGNTLVINTAPLGVYNIGISATWNGLTVNENISHEFFDCNLCAFCKVTPQVTKVDKKNIFTIYPNPASKVLNISILGSDQSSNQNKIEIYNVVGKRIRTVFVEMSESQIDISDLSDGQYFFKCTSGASNEILKLNIAN